MKPNKFKLLLGFISLIAVIVVIGKIGFHYQIDKVIDESAPYKVLLIDLIISLPIMILFSFIGYKLAIKKDLEPNRWAFVCFFLTVFACIYLWSLPDQKTAILERKNSLN